jgi:hypothetical protein
VQEKYNEFAAKFEEKRRSKERVQNSHQKSKERVQRVIESLREHRPIVEEGANMEEKFINNVAA